MRLAPEGWPFIAVAGVIAIILALAGFWWAFAFWMPVAIWTVAFFRDPEPDGPRGEGAIIAPADGKVVNVREIHEPSFLDGPAVRISIFMNVFDAHVNRYPASGTVAYRSYHPGSFLNAAREKASLENEQSSIGLSTPRGKILVRQIAGLIARRIITDHVEGTVVQQGDRMGMIRFGSRVDVFLPPGCKVLIAEGDHTRTGSTLIAEWP